jgi:hypothetical protein
MVQYVFTNIWGDSSASLFKVKMTRPEQSILQGVAPQEKTVHCFGNLGLQKQVT